MFELLFTDLLQSFYGAAPPYRSTEIVRPTPNGNGNQSIFRTTHHLRPVSRRLLIPTAPAALSVYHLRVTLSAVVL